jgi:hypothetical protein
MLSAEENKAMGKPGQRNRKKKTEPRTKAGEQQAARHDKLPDVPAEISQEIGKGIAEEIKAQADTPISGQVSAPVASGERTPGLQETPQDLPGLQASPSEASATDIVASEPVVSAEFLPVSLQTIADAYGDYTRKSLQQTLAFFTKLAAVRSPDKLLELQMEYAKEACETFVAESQKIRDLHGELAKQRATNFEGFVARITQTTSLLRATRH